MNMFAYVDPGLGLLAWQAVVAFCVGLVFYMRKTRDWLLRGCRKVLFVTKRSESASPQTEIAKPLP